MNYHQRKEFHTLWYEYRDRKASQSFTLSLIKHFNSFNSKIGVVLPLQRYPSRFQEMYWVIAFATASDSLSRDITFFPIVCISFLSHFSSFTGFLSLHVSAFFSGFSLISRSFSHFTSLFFQLSLFTFLCFISLLLLLSFSTLAVTIFYLLFPIIAMDIMLFFPASFNISTYFSSVYPRTFNRFISITPSFPTFPSLPSPLLYLHFILDRFSLSLPLYFSSLSSSWVSTFCDVET